MFNNTTSNTYTCFSAHDCLASGSLQTVGLAVKRAAESQSANGILIFDDATGRSIDIDVRGSDADMLTRLEAAFPAPTPSPAFEQPESDEDAARGRGRPKLGVVAREVTLLPRHWEWLASQPGGASVALRKLVEEARRTSAERDRKRQAQERAYRFMFAMAGDFENFEEASRALFANDQERFSQLIAVWPQDVRDYAYKLAFGD
jgi:hypothetical protein